MYEISRSEVTNQIFFELNVEISCQGPSAINPTRDIVANIIMIEIDKIMNLFIIDKYLLLNI